MARVVVALSGGVDSSTVAGLLVEQGHEVVGVHMKLHDAPSASPASAKTCCGLDDALDARRVADGLGIPFYVLNLREAFRQAVLDDFRREYRAGRTPNPCVHCNGVLKFRVLLARALALGADALATGHYARLDDPGGDPALRMAVDRGKDQSYFLFPMSRAARERTWFPLGGLTKAEVRGHAERLGLATAHKPESQDVCFLPEGDHGAFVAGDDDLSGDLVLEDGTVVGQHHGYVHFTVGQRRGLGLSLGFPAYVLRVEPETRRVVVAPLERLDHTGLVASGWHWLVDAPEAVRHQALHVRIRHRGALVPCTVGEADGDVVTLRFEGPERAVAPGQAAVLYAGDRVVGGGWIDRALEAA